MSTVLRRAPVFAKQLMKKDIRFLHTKKQRREPITVLTCYDYPTACLQDKAGIDIIFVGDSVGTNVLGYQHETEVTMGDMLHHLKAVRRGVTDAYLLVDMPYAAFQSAAQTGGYRNPPLQASNLSPSVPEPADPVIANARRFLSHGANGVKLEGGVEKVPIIAALTEAGMETCAHIGHNPQIHGTKAATHGKTVAKAKHLIETAIALADAGAKLIVLEKVTEEVSQLITEAVPIPTIGIGAGRFCDGQVLVINDVLGMGPAFKHAKRYQEYDSLTFEAICQYKQEVEGGDFPTDANAAHLAPDKLARVQKWLALRH